LVNERRASRLPRADPPRPSANQAVVGAINKAFGYDAQPSRGLKKPITKIVERERG
jgi:hypothetical protein